MEKTDKELIEHMLTKADIDWRYTDEGNIETEDVIFLFFGMDHLDMIICNKYK